MIKFVAVSFYKIRYSGTVLYMNDINLYFMADRKKKLQKLWENSKRKISIVAQESTLVEVFLLHSFFSFSLL